MIVEPPSVGQTVDEKGNARPVAFLAYRWLLNINKLLTNVNIRHVYDVTYVICSKISNLQLRPVAFLAYRLL